MNGILVRNYIRSVFTQNGALRVEEVRQPFGESILQTQEGVWKLDRVWEIHLHQAKPRENGRLKVAQGLVQIAKILAFPGFDRVDGVMGWTHQRLGLLAHQLFNFGYHEMPGVTRNLNNIQSDFNRTAAGLQGEAMGTLALVYLSRADFLKEFFPLKEQT